MITDLNRFIKLYKSVGISLKPERGQDENAMSIIISSDDHEEDQLVGGWTQCYTELLFDSTGKFIRHNNWVQ